MHGHQLRLLAEQEHVDVWTDITAGSLYGAIKRLATEELIEEIRVERHGGYPQRQVWAITEAGREALAGLRFRGLREIVVRPDPFDLAMTRLDQDHLDDLSATITARVASFRAMLQDHEDHAAAIAGYLTLSEQVVIKHRADRLRAEITWHQELGDHLPDIIADEQARRGPA
ncbi:hypothetical protein TUM20983_36990 [Mycobacterium antarcticum]|nr:hypothetical protein TUM20983_36990 [Mycolicibacterium sp. TUM20983]